jgi:succinate-semialdehyde dehydrogenase/glutarate-semialdehyde dehydrogenase
VSTFTKLYIDGEWVPGVDETPVIDPTTGMVLTSVATASVEQCVTAVDAAACAGSLWSARAPRDRAEVLHQCYRMMVTERDAIAELIQAENGKARREADAEVLYAAEFFRWFSEETARIGGEFRQSPSGDKQIVVVPEPVGVAILITPWNFPAAMAARKIAPALSAGCTCVLKPAPETPLTALYLADLIERAGAPRGVINVVLPEPPAVAVQAMLDHPCVGKVSFTGSTEVGRRVLEYASRRVVRASLELGGNAPFIVLADADLDVAVDAALIAKTRNGGASCVAANRFYVHETLKEPFTASFAHRMDDLKVGLERERDADVGALVSHEERNKVESLAERLVADGGTVRTRRTRTDSRGFFCAPVVIDGVIPDAPTLTEEIFGPVAPIVSFADTEQAITFANSSDSGLMAYIVGRDVAAALQVGRRVDAGMVAINRGVISDPAAPFGGFKTSGYGKEGGREGIDEYLRYKYVGVDL